MEKYINEFDQECYRGVEPDTLFSSLEFHEVENQLEDNIQWALHTNLGSLTVLDRMTEYGYRDTETGYRATDGPFWLATGMYDVRSSGATTVSDAIAWVKKYANTRIGGLSS